MSSSGRVIAGVVAGALAAVGFAVAPASGATENARVVKRAVVARGGGSFTPASADPRLAAMFARGKLDASGFRFTPSGTRRSERAVTVAVRARSVRGATDIGRLAGTTAAPTVGIAPIAYNLGVSVGWKRFALSSDVTRVDLAGQPGSRDRVDVGVSYAGTRFTGRVKAAADRPLAGTANVAEPGESYLVDVGGSYSIARNVDLTAGVQYRADRERLARLADDRRDSQAVYVGTAFRF